MCICIAVCLPVQVVVCGSLDELHQLVDPSQLTEELGGSIVYDHSVWIQHRAVSLWPCPLHAPGGHLTDAVETIFRKIFVGTRARGLHALPNNVECVASFLT